MPSKKSLMKKTSTADRQNVEGFGYFIKQKEQNLPTSTDLEQPCIRVTSVRAQKLWDELCQQPRNEIESSFQCASLDENLMNSHNFRADLYDSIFKGHSRLSIVPHSSEGIWTTIYDPKEMALSCCENIVILGTLLGTIWDKDDPKQKPSAIVYPSSDAPVSTYLRSKAYEHFFKLGPAKATLDIPLSCSISLHPKPTMSFLSRNPKDLLCFTSHWSCEATHVSHPSDFWLHMARMLSNSGPKISTAPVAETNARWHVVVAGSFPFLVLTSKLGVSLWTGKEIIADRGLPWTTYLFEQGLRSMGAHQMEWGNSLYEESSATCANFTPTLLVTTDEFSDSHISASRDSLKIENPNSKSFNQCLRRPQEKNFDIWPSQSSSNFHCNIRGDESPLSRLQPCRECEVSALEFSPSLNLRCRIQLQHLGPSLASENNEKSQAKLTIRSLWEALKKSESRNFHMHGILQAAKMATKFRNKIIIALKFWRDYKIACKVYESLCSCPLPSKHYHRLYESLFCDTRHFDKCFHKKLRHTTTNFYSHTLFAPNSETSRLTGFESTAKKKKSEFSESIKLHHPCPKEMCIQPQHLVDQFELSAQRDLHSRHAEDIVKDDCFESTDEESAMSKQIPKSMHKEVAKALLMSHSNLTPSISWDERANCWIAKSPMSDEFMTFFPVNKDSIKQEWIKALHWLSERNDFDAMSILAGHRGILKTSPRFKSQNDKKSIMVLGHVFNAEEQCDHDINSSLIQDEVNWQSSEVNRLAKNQETLLISDISKPTIKAGKSLPPGLIWARTTNRFFAVFRDTSNSFAASKKKRFKTFDPKKYGGILEAHEAAVDFLRQVEPWVTQHASKRGGRRPKKKICLRKQEAHTTDTRSIHLSPEESYYAKIAYDLHDTMPEKKPASILQQSRPQSSVKSFNDTRDSKERKAQE